MVDTIENACRTPDAEQPWAALGLKEDEYQRIRDLRWAPPHRRGTGHVLVERVWHCSYKSSKIHLKRFGALPQTTPRGPLSVGIGDNAGAVDIGQGLCHHLQVRVAQPPVLCGALPGAATGVGGIVRDILAMGARPIAASWMACVSVRWTPRHRPQGRGIVAGVATAIALGLPNIGGEVYFDPSYYDNPLVNALCVGVMRHEDLKFAKATGAGNKVILYGAATGADGIGGASILASETFDDSKPSKRPAVQVGDPFME